MESIPPPTSEIHDKNAALGKIAMTMQEIAEMLRFLDDSVIEARLIGASWRDIGDAAGMRSQSAHHRWRKLEVNKSSQLPPSGKQSKPD